MSNKDRIKEMFDDYMKSYKSSYGYKDDVKRELAFRKKEYEGTLDEMWRIYGTGNIAQLAEYTKQLNMIKDSGCKVYRNPQGKHKIVIQ